MPHTANLQMTTPANPRLPHPLSQWRWHVDASALSLPRLASIHTMRVCLMALAVVVVGCNQRVLPTSSVDAPDTTVRDHARTAPDPMTQPDQGRSQPDAATSGFPDATVTPAIIGHSTRPRPTDAALDNRPVESPQVEPDEVATPAPASDPAQSAAAEADAKSNPPRSRDREPADETAADPARAAADAAWHGDEPLDDVPPATADAPAVRDAWLQRIHGMLDTGDIAGARLSAHAFATRYPAYPLPEDLRALAQ